MLDAHASYYFILDSSLKSIFKLIQITNLVPPCVIVYFCAYEIWRQHPTPVTDFTLAIFFPMFPFDPPENIRKPLVFYHFQGDQKGTLGRKGLKVLWFSEKRAYVANLLVYIIPITNSFAANGSLLPVLIAQCVMCKKMSIGGNLIIWFDLV